MNITPLEIRQKQFERVFRGYSKEEVDAYLASLSQAWEKMLDEQRELRLKTETLQQEVHKLREIENSLFKTLKTAEDTSHNIIDQAQKKSDLQLREAQLKVDALLKDARWKAKTIVEDAEDEAKQTYTRLQREVQALEREYNTLESYRDNLLNEFKNLAKDAISRVERAEMKSAKASLEFARTAALSLSSHDDVEESREEPKPSRRLPEVPEVTAQETPEPERPTPDAQVEEELPEAETEEDHDTPEPATPEPDATQPQPPHRSKSGGSFFDQLG
ncbi:cell division initiation protein [Catalinimonas alkaloidigena]|uniref:Cell division initiation protein n=1 Tax=Catalinimonas alkaloidigena TaxID=1075417 RepID=A0A1G8XLD0_9BACT|nr:DivIVA domain-containing protein [Catalinimonas alkaloidigena]SDJ91246.1 cell division initiation protein [Catalinimonas alkaloidigena]